MNLYIMIMIGMVCIDSMIFFSMILYYFFFCTFFFYFFYFYLTTSHTDALCSSSCTMVGDG